MTKRETRILITPAIEDGEVMILHENPNGKSALRCIDSDISFNTHGRVYNTRQLYNFVKGNRYIIHCCPTALGAVLRKRIQEYQSR